MSDVSSYFYNKNGLRVKYTIEYANDPNWGGDFSDFEIMPDDFMPFPGFEKRSFFQTVKYRIRNNDWFGNKERRQRKEMQDAHERKRTREWMKKEEAEEKKRKQEIADACKPEKLRATGVDKLLQQIKEAKSIDIEGTRSNGEVDFYKEVELSLIDEMTIDLRARLATCTDTGVVVSKIPKLQIRAVYQALNNWRQFVIKNGKRIR